MRRRQAYLVVGSTVVFGMLLAVGLVPSRTHERQVHVGAVDELPSVVQNTERVPATEPSARERPPQPTAPSPEPRYPILLPHVLDDPLTSLFASESKDPSWSDVTEAQIVGEIARLSGLSLVTMDVECRATLCRVQSVLPTTDATAWHKIVGVAANLGLEAPLPFVAVNNTSRTTVLLAYFSRSNAAPRREELP